MMRQKITSLGVVAVCFCLTSTVQASFIFPLHKGTALSLERAVGRPSFANPHPIKHPIYELGNLRGGTTSSTSTSTSSTSLRLTPSSLFDNGPFWGFNLVIVAANLLGFVISLLSGGSHLHLDLLGTGAFALAAIPTGFASDVARVQLSAGLVSVWATKLASFLFLRALQLKHDARLSTTLSTVSGTAFFWVFSLVWGVITSLPHSLGATSSYNTPILQSPCGIAGAVLFVVGFLTETTADLQKTIFKRDNPGKFCNAGLWSISQHPNWLGNLLIWTGIFLLNAPALIDPPSTSEAATNIFQSLWRFKRLALAALSPLFLYTLFSAQASGSLTNAQELATKKYGSDPNFQRYLETVPLIFPNPLKLFQSSSK